jgi:hypothetical protein
MKRLASRHWAFLGLFIVVLVTMLLNLRPDVQVSSETKRMFDYIDSLPAGSALLISFDHEASSLPEIRPLAVALLRHAFYKNLKLVGISLLAEGTVIGYRLMQLTAGEYGKLYGVDYVYLGFKPQYIAAILSMGESFKNTFPEDYLGHPYDSIPMLQRINSYADIAAVVSVSDGSMPTHWMEYGKARYGVTITSVMTAAMLTTFDPYVASGQLHALAGGLRGAAEYEKLLGKGGGGGRGMLAQATSHYYIIALIIVGNLLYFAARRKGKEA